MIKRKFPKISIITPTLNQAQYLNDSIESVLSQKYPNLEYIIIDGGSADGTKEILKKYKNRLKWISEKDSGQSSAINKGLSKVSGEIIGYLNSDDLLVPNSLQTIADFFRTNPHAKWVTGYCTMIDEKGYPIRSCVSWYKKIWLRWIPWYSTLLVLNFISQPSTFWRKSVFDTVKYFDEKLHYSMDYDYWVRLYKHFNLSIIHSNISKFRIHRNSKSMRSLEEQLSESLYIIDKYSNSSTIKCLHKLHDFFIRTIYNKINLL